MAKYWRRALDVRKEILNLDKDEISNVNSDKVPVVLANKYTNDFDYRVCEKIVHQIERDTKKRNSNSLLTASSIDVDDIVSQTGGIWYHQKQGEAEKAELRIEELKFEKKQYEEKKRQIKKPKGMSSGLCIFVVFSILGVIFPLICALMKFDNLCMPIVSLILFGGCIFITFIYLVLLLRWKSADMEVTRNESNSPEGKL